MAINCISLLLRGSCRQSFRTIQSAAGICQCSNSTPRIVEFSSNRQFNSFSPSFQVNTATAASTTHKLSSNPTPLSKNEESIESKEIETLSRLAEGLKWEKRLMEEPEETEPHVVYKGLLADQMRRLKLFSLTTSAMGLAMQPVLIQRSVEIPLGGKIAAFGMVGFFTFGTPILIHLIAKKYVNELVYDPQNDSYQATTLSFFMRTKKTVFTIDDVKVPEVPGPFTTLTIKNAEGKYDPFFLAPESFLKPSHYGRLMGFDKPINLHLTLQNEDSKSRPGSSQSRNE
ncbi:unnamed protein product [Orchesella dallaii]|uniref:Transmembrane protein n=1 Tax=Orchesella dallaii TaxID=48710 RepID=A0ABP1QB91_9HEXA